MKFNGKSAGDVGKNFKRIRLLPGEKIYLLCVYYGGVIIRAKGKKIALGRDMADSIKV